MITWSQKLDDALYALYKREPNRVDVSHNWYHEFINNDSYYVDKIVCKLCGYESFSLLKIAPYSELLDDMRQHGLYHLKESNLLPFI